MSTRDGSRSPLAATAARLVALDSSAGFEVEPDPRQAWADLACADRSGRLDAWLTSLVSRHGHRGAAGSLLGESLTRAVLEPTVSAMVLDARCPDPAAENLAVRMDEDGYLLRTAVLHPTVAVLAGDAAADPRCVVVEDEAALLRWWARGAAATLTPLLAAIRSRAPFGLPALWGGVSDRVTDTALWIGQLAGRDPYAVWSYAQRMIDALAAHAPVRLTRARPFPLPHRGGDYWFQVRATCCLSYRSTVDDGPVEERYCSTCPLRDDSSRRRHLGDYLESLATGTG